MATAAVTYSFTASTTAVSAQVNQNFTDLVTFLNGSVIHKDGSVAFTAVPTGPATDPSSSNHLTRKAYVDALVNGAWTDYSPSHSNITVGNGTQVAKYKAFGDKFIAVRWSLALGSTSAIGSGGAQLGLPQTAHADGYQALTGFFIDTGTRTWVGSLLIQPGATRANFISPDGTEAGATTTTNPFTWTTGDVIAATGVYERS